MQTDELEGKKSEIKNSFKAFFEADDFAPILSAFSHLSSLLGISSTRPIDRFQEIYDKAYGIHFKFDSLLSILKIKYKDEIYSKSNGGNGKNVLVVGAGPGGLRASIEMALLGCDTIKLIEKRDSFSRNNVLHLWPFSVTDIKSLGGKVLFSKFGVGCLDHISIRRIQIIFLKIVLILGIEVKQMEFDTVVKTANGLHRLENDPDGYLFNVLIGGDGENSKVANYFQFEKRFLNFGSAIGISANFVRVQTEKCTGKVGGRVSYLNRPFFNNLRDNYNVELENIVYYADETHYLVMTAKKSSLFKWKVLKQDYEDATLLLSPDNLNIEQLEQFIRCVASVQGIPSNADFVQTCPETKDFSIFDFSTKSGVKQPSKLFVEDGLFVALVGDALIAPFWPLGTGLAHACLSALDIGWIIHRYGDSLWKENPEDLIEAHRGMVSKLEACSSETMFKRNIYPLDPDQRYKTYRYSI